MFNDWRARWIKSPGMQIDSARVSLWKTMCINVQREDNARSGRTEGKHNGTKSNEKVNKMQNKRKAFRLRMS
ncbi:hypothetical protein Bhyg_05973 [Pseudolycoriella hygida]|uniref:Uncharacterized protein n=1 Tax=Pseudolycoriella hygida TaxID=35572 RepID=A0A9Q0S2H5_9DIPT|nr:hypothetical protein Bhyg_05973 [Pseudolycoriella hygida]